MADETKQAWLNWLAITTIIFSACSTLSTFKGGSFSTKSVLAQTSASNMWAYFQAKSVKQHGYQLQRDVLQLAAMNSQGEQAKAHLAKIDEYSKEIDRYDQEKKQAETDARNFEKSREEFQRNSATFGMAVVFLQVAIMLSALSALLKKKPVWMMGVVLGAVGLVYFAGGLWHWFGM